MNGVFQTRTKLIPGRIHITNSHNSVSIVVANYTNTHHTKDILLLFNQYSCDPMGNGKELPEYVKNHLITKLSKIAGAFSLLCYVDSKPAGLAIGFETFSTFKCQAVINIHDLFVSQEFRGLGLSHKLLQKIEDIARERACCKITMEVLEGNGRAISVYRKFGFSGYELDPTLGQAMFWEKISSTTSNPKLA